MIKKHSLAFVLAVMCPLFARADSGSPASFDREFTVGISFPRQRFDGDFDGKRFYSDGNAVIVVPEVEPAIGIGIMGGIKSRVHDDVAIGIDVALNTAQHDVTWAGASGKATSVHIDFDFKLFANAREKLQPFLLGGMSVSGLRVDGGYVSLSEEKDATFTGVGYHVGMGLNYYLSPRVSLNGSLRNRWLTFDEVNYGSRRTLDKKLKSSAIDMALGVAYHFNLGG
jgi:opacity protein-like surface antigen